MRILKIYISMLFVGLSISTTAQDVLFKSKLGFGTKTPLAIYSQIHSIEVGDMKKAQLTYKSNQVQSIKNTQDLFIGKLTIDNPSGLGLQNSLHIANNLMILSGHLFSLPKKNNALEQTTVLYIAKEAQLTTHSFVNYVKLPIQIQQKAFFTFPLGHEENLTPIEVATQSKGISLEMSYEQLDNNRNTTNIYSTENYMKRLGIKALKLQGRWRLKTTETQEISIRVERPIQINELKQLLNPGIAAWNVDSNNWNILPLASQANGFIVSEFFPANQYSHFTFCDCVTPPKKYTPYGNHAVSPNGDGINDIPIFTQYKHSRNGQFELFNRHGIRVFHSDWNSVLEGKVSLNLPQLKTDTYFYVLSMTYPKQKEQGYLFIKK